MSAASPLLIVCFNPQDAQPDAELARAIGYADPQVLSGSLAEAINALNARASNPPEFLILDIGARGKDVLPDLDQMAQHCEPTMQVVIIGQVNDITFYRELKQRGILEYFPKPVQPTDIRAVMMQTGAQKAAGSGDGSVIACMSAASGDGASTTAINI